MERPQETPFFSIGIREWAVEKDVFVNSTTPKKAVEKSSAEDQSNPR
jgi:hypothetical protein